ncbi:methyltransferase domain-containing protein [Niveibacterium sp. SC-1]|uniref:methyltransferase domain-containing protein n=1 Tax=Niveibacterium sp. SC-1 TaxID=3135646 RepID=UPI00311D9FA7
MSAVVALKGAWLADRQSLDPGLGMPLAIDYGAGEAPYRSIFSTDCRYVTADIGADSKADLRFEADSPLPASDASAQLVLSFQVLEHVWDVGFYLSEARRVLEKDGHLLLSTHGAWLYHPHPGDYRRWTRAGLIREIEAGGFEVLSVRPVVGPLAWSTQIRLLGVSFALSRLGVVGRGLAAILALITYPRMWMEDSVTPGPIVLDNAAIYAVLARKRA